ncbi:MAG: DUF459 domain-containing protein [Actinobacteria bacterium]|nr:DUF459 domain-containing protein [Actinomycetota bacterium]
MSSPHQPRSRPSGRRYAARRLGVLAVVLLVGYSLFKVVSGALGGDDGVADANGSESAAAISQDDTSSTDSSGTTDPAGTTATTDAPVETDPPGPPTATNPAKVFIVGDSDAGTFGPYLEQLLDGTQIVDTELDYKVSSGLARPDFFDWPAELRDTLPEVDPDIVVVTFGGNDAQGLSVIDGEFIIGDPVANEAEWTEEYTNRAGEVMDLLLEDGRTVIWVGIPNDDNPEVTERMAIQDQAAKAAAVTRPEVIFIDTWTRFSGRDGGWAEFVIDPRDGEGKDVRAGDGFHLNTTGAEILALDIAQEIRDTLRDLGASI